MKPLTSSQRKRLRGLAHALDPLVHLGKAGLTDAALAQIDKELADHELIKIRFLESGSGAGKAEKDARIDEIQNRIGCGAAGRVGHIAILYRPHADPDKRRIDPGKQGAEPAARLAAARFGVSWLTRLSTRVDSAGLAALSLQAPLAGMFYDLAVSDSVRAQTAFDLASLTGGRNAGLPQAGA